MDVTLAAWGPDDIAVLERANTAEMTRFLGGVEAGDDLAVRHAQYLAFAETGEGAMFRIEVDGQPAGYAGWWQEEHDGMPVYEIGCAVDPAWQRRGVAAAALTEVVRRSAVAGDRHIVVGYAAAGNEASNALCRRVGFVLAATGRFPTDEGDVEVNVWVIDTSGWRGAASADAPLASSEEG